MDIKNKYTRRIDREYMKILYEGCAEGGTITINPYQMQLANDYLVKEMTEVSQNDLDNMSAKEYQKTLEAINKLKGEEDAEKKN